MQEELTYNPNACSKCDEEFTTETMVLLTQQGPVCYPCYFLSYHDVGGSE